MKFLRLLIWLSLCAPVLAQQPLMTGSGVDWTRATSSAATPPGDMWVWAKNEAIRGTNSGQVITATWIDSSGNNHGFTPTSGGVGVTNNVVNGFPAVYCQGAQYFTEDNSLAIMQNVDGGAVFLVVTNQDLEGSYMEIRTGTAANNRFSTAWAAAGKMGVFARALDADSGATSAQIPVTRGFVLVECLITYTNQHFNLYTNGTAATSSTSFTTANKTSNTASTAAPRLCQNGTGIIGVSEVLIYNRPVTDAERTNNIEPYFRTKFNLW